MSTITISAADVNKLRQQTGAGMMDCKKALTEANGDFEAAIDYLRKKGQKVAANRSDRDATEGAVIAKVSADGKFGALVVLNCETDFVAINADFVAYATQLTDLAIANKCKTVEELKAATIGTVTVADSLFDMVGKIGEKIDVSKLDVVEASKVAAYIHPGNKLACLVGFSSDNVGDLGKEVAIQVAAMAPIAVDKDDVDAEVVQREIEIGKDQARQEGKAEEMLEKIAQGKLNKFYKENTLLNQQSLVDDSKTVAQVLNDQEKGLTVTTFKRVKLGA